MKAQVPNSCNVLELDREQRRLWRFHITGAGSAHPTEELHGPVAELIPARHVAKDWRGLFHHRLNIAWLPPGHFFLRVAQFPKCDFPELVTMVELQLEKLSPLPLAQIVWSVERVPTHSTIPSEMQTVLVLIAARHEVEKFLGTLEARGYLADRLEVPELHQLFALRIESDGVWLLPRTGGEAHSCLVAWWYGGELRNLTLANLTGPEHWGRELGELLAKSAWAGEIEGWLTSPPKYHLVAAPDSAGPLHGLLQELAGGAVEVEPPLGRDLLAQRAAQGVARRETHANLLPPEFAARYRQQFIDGVWMRGLGTLIVVYLLGVLAYFGALEALKYKKNGLEAEVAALAGSYTNSLITKARVQVLQEQMALKFAAIESLKATAATLPDGLTLTDFSFSKGRTVHLRGVAPTDQISRITDYNSALARVELNGAPLFKSVGAPSISGSGANPQQSSWSFQGELRITELE